MSGELSRIARIAVERATLWYSRARERRVLGELDERMLRDIGLTRSEAEVESERAFWQGDDFRMILSASRRPRRLSCKRRYPWPRRTP
jgi:uncharacterized protein YjiS (DUF1127 family)